MKPLMKIAGWSAAGFIGLVIVCVVVIKSISDDQYKKWVIDAASSATGRQLAFDGDFNIHLGKDITLKAKDIRLANAEKGTRPDMITVDRLLLKVALLPILRGVLDFVVEIDSPDILLETNADGRGNWVFADPTLEEAEPEQKNQEPAGSFALPLKPYIRNFEITNLQFAFHDKVASDKHISADIDTLKIFVDGNEIPLTLKAAYNGAPIELSGILGRIDALHANRITDTSLDGKLNEANLTIAGTIGPLAPKLNANLDLLLKADTVSTFSPFAGISLPDLQELDISLTAHATEGKFAAEDIKILVNDDSLHLNIAGNIGDLSEGAGIRLTTEINSENLDTILDQMGIKPLSGLPASLSIEGVATGSLKVLALDSLNVVVEDEGLAMNITGKATNLLAPAGVDVNITATIDTVARISKFAGKEIPDLGAIDLKGQIISKNQKIRLDNLNIKLGNELLDAQVDAVIEDLMALAKVAEKPDNYGAAGVVISLKADAASISQLAQAAGAEIPELGSLQLVGKISSAKQSLRLESLEAVVKQQGINTKATASVADLITLSGIDGTADIEIESLSALSTLTESELPQTGPWALNVTAAAAETKGATEIVVNLTSDGIEGVINANIPEIQNPGNLQASLSLDAESLAVIGALLDREMAAEGPVKLTAKAVAKPEEYRVDDFLLTLGDGAAQANLQYTIPPGEQNKPKLVGQMEIRDFDLTKILPTSKDEPDTPDVEAEVTGEAETAENLEENENKEAMAESETEAGTTGDKKLFSKEPLATGALQDYEVDLKVNTSNLTLAKDFMVHGSLAVTLADGVLKLGPLDLKGEAGGSGESLIVLDASNPEANLDVKIKFDDFVSPRFGGNLDLDVDLDGSGDSIAAVMGSLNGRFIAAINDYTLKQSAMTRFGSGLFSRINPVKKDTTMLECAIIRFDAKDGMADFTDKIAAQTTEVTWFGSGEINLKTEELDLGIHPEPRKVISSLTDLELAGLIHIGGTLAEPSIGIDPKDVALKYGKYSAYIATGGLSWLAETVLDHQKSNVDQCERILGELKKNDETDKP